MFNFSGELLSTNPYDGYTTQTSLSGLGISHLTDSLYDSIQQTWDISQNAAGTVFPNPNNLDASMNITPIVKNHITYNINGCMGIGIIPNTQLPFLNQNIYSKLSLMIWYKIILHHKNLSFPYDAYGSISNAWCMPLEKSLDSENNTIYTTKVYGPYMSPYKLDISGNAIIRGLLSSKTSYTISDKIVKDNIETIPNALDKVNNMRGVYYDHKELNNKRCAGVIAQELENVLPEAVTTVENLKQVSYNDIVGVFN